MFLPLCELINQNLLRGTWILVIAGQFSPSLLAELGFEKRQIGDDIVAACSGRPLCLDISSQWRDRISGISWFDFLANSKAVLGVESGSNLFDFTGEVEARCNEFCQTNPHRDQLSAEFYAEAHGNILKDYEGNVNYAQISPRHFEAAATQTLQILYQGKYSGILIPFRHYIPLRRDLSNLDEVLGLAADERYRTAITEAAYAEIVQNERFQYDSFVSEVDTAFLSALTAKGRLKNKPDAARSSRAKALVLVPHEPVLDPRIDWMAAGLAYEYEVCEIGTYHFNDCREGPSVEPLGESRFRIRVERTRHNSDWIPAPGDLREGSPVALHQLALLHIYAGLPSRVLARTVGAFDADEGVLSRFRQLCRYFVNTNGALIQAARLTGRFDLIVAADLEFLPAALILGYENKAAVIYDAHEYWPYSYLDFRHWENEFWAGLEDTLVRQAAIRVTVSPPLAAHMSSEYGCEFKVVPNCCPIDAASGIDVGNRLRARAGNKEVDFLFLGQFAPGRGIDLLIRAWPSIDTPARLLLRGPPGPFKEEMELLADSLGVKGTHVLFPEPVHEDQLVFAASEADVGIIPYEPDSIAYRFACPNKLSQYLAAGLPVISNDLPFVKATLSANGLGAAVSFRDTEELVRTIKQFADRNVLREMSTRAQNFFKSTFNWENVSSDFYAEVRTLIRPKQTRNGVAFDFSWIEAEQEMHEPAIEALSAEPLSAGPMIVPAQEVNDPAIEASSAEPLPGERVTPPASLPNSRYASIPRRRPRGQLYDLLVHSRTRAMARSMIAPLPERLSHRVKARLVLLLGHLN